MMVEHVHFLVVVVRLMEELDPVHFILILTIVLIGRPPPISIIASKLGFPLVYLSSSKL
jgi:hypothetical protein